MKLRQSIRSLRLLAVILGCCSVESLLSQQPTQQPSQPPGQDPTIPIIKATSNLVFLDVTVLDKKGHPVDAKLTRDDFTVTEYNKPQTITSFESPASHLADGGESPITILVLDVLNTNFSDMAYIRYSVRQFLALEPEKLKAPMELLVVGNTQLEMLQGFTGEKQDILFALNHLPPIYP